MYDSGPVLDDLLGRTVVTSRAVREVGSYTGRVDASALPAGTYLVRVRAAMVSGASVTQTQRVTVQR